MTIGNAEMKKVSEGFERLESNTKKAIRWVNVNSSAPCVNKSASTVKRNLTEVLVNARRLKAITSKPCSIGLFGQSQAGKSYLVSCLAGNEKSDLIAKFGQDTYNFIKDINPSGGGKESTGLVTRFTILDKDECVFEYPVKVELLQEVEIAMILINSFYEDSYESPDTPNKEKCDSLINRLQNFSASGKRNSLVEDEVILFKNYLYNNKSKLYKSIPKTLWDNALDLLPALDLEDRAEFYSFFWNKNEVFTRCFKTLAKYIGQIKSNVIYLQLSSLLVNESKGLSIVNVDALKQFNENDEELKYSTKDGNIGRIPRSILAAIIAELYIHVKDPQYKDEILSKMDLLDFPGYRGRLNENIEDFNNDAFEIKGQSGRSKIAECFLRGKVAYLFEKYIDNHDLNCLVVCADSTNQIESGIDNVIDRWLKNTQGKNPDERRKHQSGLFWVLTKFDMRLSADLDKNPEYGKNGLLQQTFLERFGKFEWVGNWDGTEDNPKPFKNIFLVRKLNQSSCSFIQVENNKESFHIKDKITIIDKHKEIFISDPEIKKYFEYPDRAWDEVVGLNNGGIKFLCDKIRTTDALKIRYSKFIEILHKDGNTAKKQIQDWYQDDNKEALLSKKYTQLRALGKKEVLVHFGEILDLFNIPENIIRECYYYDQNANFYLEHGQEEKEQENQELSVSDLPENNLSTSNEKDDAEDDFDFDFADIFDEDIEKDKLKVNVSASKNSVVSNNVATLKLETSARIYNNWYDYLTNLNSNIKDIPDSLIEFLASEIKGFAERTNLAQVLDQKLKEISNDMGKKDSFYPSVQSVVNIVISDFISTLNNTVKIPEVEELAENEFPQLPSEAIDPIGEKKIIASCWFNQIKQIVKENLAHVPNGITKDENIKLGEYISEYSSLEDVGNE